MDIDKKHKVEISLTTSEGADNIPEGYFGNVDSLYFILKPLGDWEISGKDLKEIRNIVIKQSDVDYKNNRIFPETDGSKEIKRVLLVFEKVSVNLANRFEFKLGENLPSDAMAIPEKYWPHYPEFIKYYEEGKKQKDEKNWIKSFDQFKYILSESENSIHFRKFDDKYKRVYHEFIPEIILAYQTDQSKKLEGYQSKLGDKERASLNELEQIRAIKDSTLLIQDVFELYYSIKEPTNIDLLGKHKALVTSYNEFYNAVFEAWKNSELSIIEEGTYDQKKFKVYINLLGKLLIYKNHLSTLTQYNSIDVTLISVPEKEPEFLKQDIDILESMERANWKSDFIIMVDLLNHEIKNNKQLVNQNQLMNLFSNKDIESQPNYYIIDAFNELVKGQYLAFEESIRKAIRRCSDRDMLYYLELWIYSNKLKSNQADTMFISSINKGLDFEEKGLPSDAVNEYEFAKNLTKSALPPFFIGRLEKNFYHNTNAAERLFNESIQTDSEFSLARVYHIETQLENEQYNEVLAEIEAVLNIESLNIWYIYFLKAKTLYLMGNPDEALNIIQNFCKELNPKNFEQSILLGDIYLSITNCEKAKEYYREAGDINPRNEVYEKSMERYLEQCKN